MTKRQCQPKLNSDETVNSPTRKKAKKARVKTALYVTRLKEDKSKEGKISRIRKSKAGETGTRDDVTAGCKVAEPTIAFLTRK